MCGSEINYFDSEAMAAEQAAAAQPYVAHIGDIEVADGTEVARVLVVTLNDTDESVTVRGWAMNDEGKFVEHAVRVPGDHPVLDDFGSFIAGLSLAETLGLGVESLDA